MKRSIIWRFVIIGVLTLVMSIPLFMVADVINERAQYSRSAISTVSQEWGGVQTIGAPVLVVPVQADVTRTIRQDVIDPETRLVIIDPETKKPAQRVIEKRVTENRDPIFLSPGDYDLDIITQTDERKRGLFKVPVYRAQVAAQFQFDAAQITPHLSKGERLRADHAELWFYVANTRALRGDAKLSLGDRVFDLEPLSNMQGFHGFKAAVGKDALNGDFELVFGTNGAQTLGLAPAGRRTAIQVASDWAHPKFSGAFLPDTSDTSENGFTANWTIPHLSLNQPQAQRSIPNVDRGQGHFKIGFYQPNDFYQKAFRAGRYGILFIALTFLAVLLVERSSGQYVHPFQYLMIGIAQALWVILMVALAEHLGFFVAYWGAMVATVGLITAYAGIALKLGKGAWGIGAGLTGIYGVLFVILQAQDTALLAGAILSFAALALVMFATKDEDWGGSNGSWIKALFQDKPTKPGAPTAPKF